MTTVFQSNPRGTNPFESSEWVRGRVLDALAGKEWVAIGALYPATSRRVKRDLLHATLKQMLAAREIRMRILPVNGARDRTEFRLLANTERSGAERPTGAPSSVAPNQERNNE